MRFRKVVKPVCDLAGRAIQNLKAGTVLKAVGHHHVIEGVEPILLDAFKVKGSNPVPFYLMDPAELTRDVPAGSVIGCDMVRFPPDSALRRLRTEQDRLFDEVQGRHPKVGQKV